MSVEHTFRVDGYGGERTGKLSPIKAIRQNCRECYGFAPSVAEDIRECPSEKCALWPFRFGKDPGKRVSESQREHGRRLAELVNCRKGRSTKNDEFSVGGSPNTGEKEGGVRGQAGVGISG